MGVVEGLSRGGALMAATTYLELGDTVAAWEMLEVVVDVEMGAGITSLVAWPFFDPLREDPRFGDLLARIGNPNQVGAGNAPGRKAKGTEGPENHRL